MIAATPSLIWMFAGMGLPWALVVLPRRDWRDWPMVACLMLAFGPALVTAWMFVLGSFGQPWLRLDTVLVGTAVLAATGWAVAWRKRHSLTASASSHVESGNKHLTWDERLLIGLIVVALVVRWMGVAYWPSTAYDALWVYAYEGKLYTLLGYIPNTIGYYPQFLPLQHTFLQLAVGGVDDHAARAVLPWLHVGSILAAYVLGNRLFNRRVGVFVAAIWALYPHVGEWSRFGDLEIPVAFLFTAAAAFFLMAWCNPLPLAPSPLRREGESTGRYAVIAGLLLGIGMWTKPTMGAFIWGVVLMLGVEFVRRLLNYRQGGQSDSPARFNPFTWPRVQVAIWTGLASIPLGAAWYVRNVLNGHQPIDLPPGFWQTLAAQSGVEFGWPLLAVLVLVGWVVFSGQRSAVSGQGKEVSSSESQVPSQTNPTIKTNTLSGNVWGGLLVGLGLMLAGVVPSILQPHRMGIIEWLALGAGSILLFMMLWRWAEGRWTDEGRDYAAKIGWGLTLALPYFVTWFFSYSYHYRLSFAIVPLLILPTGVILTQFRVSSFEFRAKNRKPNPVLQGLYAVVLVALAIPGIIAPLYDPNAGWDWLWTDKLPDDHARYESGNPALMSVVDGLQIYLDTHDEPMRVVAPGVKQLPFFFPLEDIQIDHMPTQLEELEDMTYFIYGVPESGGDFNTFVPGHNQVLDALAMGDDGEGSEKKVLRRAWWRDDGIFKYSVYELFLKQRWQEPEVTIQPDGEVVFGDFARFMGYDILSHEFNLDRRIIANFFWQVLDHPPADYVIYIHLRDQDGNLLTAWDSPITRTTDGNYYSSLVWDPGEYIIDQRTLKVTDPNVPLGDNYQVVIGLYDRVTGERVPVTIDGEPAGDGFRLEETFSMLPGVG